MRPEAATLPLVIVGAVIAWWGWKSGAYFGVVFLPGTVALLALLVALLVFAPWPGRLRGPLRVALFCLLGISALSLLSGLWSPAPEIAVSDAQRVLAYAVALGLGAWLCLLLGPRMLLSLAPVAAGSAVVAVATLIALGVGDNVAEFLEQDATLRYPLGYRNAVAAFFGIALWPMLTLAASREIPWFARGALVGTAALSIQLAVLSQSRAAAFAIVVAAAVVIALHPARLRMVGYILLAAVPAALALPWLLDVFTEEGGATADSLPALHTACAAAAVTSLLAALVGCLLSRNEPRLSPGAERAVSRGLLGLVALILLAGVVGLATAEGGPAGFVDRNLEELTAGSPDLADQGSRFGLDLRSERGDLWRVSLDRLAADPLRGEGAGGFRFAYLLDRDSNVQPEDPHSVEMLMGSELGVPGLLLFAGFAVAAVVAVARARRLGPSAAALAAGSLAAASYWLVQASVDWFWHYPAITLPVMFLLGAAAAPALLGLPSPRSGVRRAGLALAAVLAAVAAVPFFLSERLTNQALRGSDADLAGAYSDLELAADLNPLSSRPLAAEAVIAEEAGESQRALGALSRAQQRHPDEWTLYFLEAGILEEIDRGGARRAIERARELNPQGPELDELEGRLTGGP
jgi:O-antigen ligase